MVKVSQGQREVRDTTMTLADAIEEYLLGLVRDAQKALEVSRRELAARFRCAPSQINYVLETRFTPERGFVVRSRRGGGGCILIIPVTFEGSADVLRTMYRQAARGLTPVQARHLVRLLLTQGVVSDREARLMEAALNVSYGGPGDETDARVRGRVMRAMLEALLS